VHGFPERTPATAPYALGGNVCIASPIEPRSVMTEVYRGHATTPIRPRRFQNTRALTHVTAKIVAMP
jgi:hypothetical protein